MLRGEAAALPLPREFVHLLWQNSGQNYTQASTVELKSPTNHY